MCFLRIYELNKILFNIIKVLYILVLEVEEDLVINLIFFFCDKF